MSTRYGISVTLDPVFTAGLHRARQVICSQYGCWAAEMHSVHLPLTGYFSCPEQETPSLAVILERIVGEFRQEHQEVSLETVGVNSETEGKGSVFLEFVDGDGPYPGTGAVSLLQADVAEALNRLNLVVGGESLPLRFALLQYSGLPAQVFQSAARFAVGVVSGLNLPSRVSVSELALFRYESAADEGWDEGAWATDLSWQIVNSYPLLPARYP